MKLFMFQIPYYVGPLGQEYKDKKDIMFGQKEKKILEKFIQGI
ncbi:MAG: hypothetical protein ACLUD0_03350 [Eubacterium ramulus]